MNAWNGHDRVLLRDQLSMNALLDMSTNRQKAAPPVVRGGHSSAQGRGSIVRFIARQWKLGERLHYESLKPFEGGTYAIGLTARFADGSSQPMAEAKFGFDCSSRTFNHIVISSRRVAEG